MEPSINRLADESSPYLLQHADNPVDWFPWGDDAFDKAKAEDKPIFLSVGYSSCHWCHVMAHESFEDDEVAGLLNERFVNVKVDREERPDVDSVYMQAVQALTGHGGWPMSVFLTPEGRPFYGGTYWPRQPRGGMPGFVQVVDAVHDAWTNRRDEVLESAGSIAEAIGRTGGTEAAEELDLGITDEVSTFLRSRAVDRHHGGFGRAPKFPQAMTIEFLLDRHARTGEPDELLVAGQALDAMARGGIHDHVGGGFARYSTDARWLVPHFEKMLYDNALLLAAYAKAWVASADERFARTARSTADYLLREMRDEGGAFFSATDADSEGVEGKFFTWSRGEFVDVAAETGADPELFAAFFGVTAEGNWEGTNILHEPVPREQFVAERGVDPDAFAADLERVRQALYEHRSQRVPPGLDDKILTSWNALAIRGLVRAGVLLDEVRYVEAAAAAATFIDGHLVVDGHLHHTFKDGQAKVPALLEDVALLAVAYLDLYAATGAATWFTRARELATDALDRFHDDEQGGFFATADDAETLITRPKDTWDNAQPSGNSALADAAARLAAYTGEPRWQEVADEVVRLFQDEVRRAPTGYGYLLQVVEFLRAGPREVAIVGEPGPPRRALERVVRRELRPGTVVAVASPGDAATAVVPLLAGRGEVDGRPAAYVCRNFACERPVTDPDDLERLLAG